MAKKTIKKKADRRTTLGFRPGTDTALIAGIMLAGGLDRQDINEKVAAAIAPTTKSGKQKNIPSLVSGVLLRLEAKGYFVESSWRVVPPPVVAAVPPATPPSVSDSDDGAVA